MSVEQPLQRIAEGREAEIFAWEEGRVLKLFRDPQAHHRAEWEAAAMAAAGSVGNAVPASFGTTEVMGRPGLVMERVQGQDLLSTLEQRPWRLFQAGRLLGELHARLHAVTAPPELPEVKASVATALARPVKIPEDIAAAAREVLRELPDGDALCHGDFHPANVVVTPRGPVVIDWPAAHRGDPGADLARSYLLLLVGEPPNPSLFLRIVIPLARKLMYRSYFRAYSARRPVDPVVLDRWKLVMAAVRLEEEIPGEREGLLRTARRMMERR